MADKRMDMLENAIKSIERQYGKGSIMVLGDDHHLEIPVIPSGAFSLDIALGVGGYPRGRIVEIYGPESSGKTTLALHAIAEVHKRGGMAAFIDAEHALDVNYARKLGVKENSLIISQPDYGEQALDIVETLVKSNALDLIVIDSVAALVPKAELEGDMGDSHVGLQARLMSQALRKLTSPVHGSNTCVIFINQLRSKIGVMFGNPETTTGGNALKFYASVRLDVRKIANIKEKDKVIGNQVKVKVVKNKLAAPFKEAHFDILYGRGIDRLGDLIKVATESGIITKAGSWYSYGDVKLGQGTTNVSAYLKEHPELTKEIVAKVKEYYELPREEELKKEEENAESKA